MIDTQYPSETVDIKVQVESNDFLCLGSFLCLRHKKCFVYCRDCFTLCIGGPGWYTARTGKETMQGHIIIAQEKQQIITRELKEQVNVGKNMNMFYLNRGSQKCGLIKVYM
ncbi:hypothetical protein ACJX0J_011953 [Zea mays]